MIDLKREFSTSNARFVYSKNELGYQEVLNRFEDANEINIITFNISEKQNSLISALKKVSENCTINVITNIPNRWETYYGDSFRYRARQKINLYMSKLNPEKLGINSTIFFDFSNHGKIIMTDTIVYVGSANYSEESANNSEFGFLSEDKAFIEFIRTEILPDVQKSAIPYYEYDYTALLLESNVALSAVFKIKNELYDEVYRLHEDFGGEYFYYVEYDASLTTITLENITKIVDEACNVARDIYDAIDVITKGDEDETILANDAYEELLVISSRIEEICMLDTLIELAEFDTNEFIIEELQNEYAMESYEENLQSCIDSASEDALCIVYDLTKAAKEDVDDLLNELQKFGEKYSAFIENLRTREFKKINANIDNT
ncbi:MAG: 6-phosphogluconolactonase [Oscillospiraceae bacterium]|nr:6-phosphogluconolactonase [Oscillospiraceae bacterium]